MRINLFSGPFEIVSKKAGIEVSGGGDFAIMLDPSTDSNGTAYIAYDAWGNNHAIVIEQLTPDYHDSLGMIPMFFAQCMLWIWMFQDPWQLQVQYHQSAMRHQYSLNGRERIIFYTDTLAAFVSKEVVLRYLDYTCQNPQKMPRVLF